MAAATQTPAPGEIACPDPSAHEHHQKQSAAASTAALLAAQPDRSASQKESPLGPDGKLSSRSAATSLKYAQPQDLPSFPSKGGNMSAASAAALLAKDHKMKDLWQPEMSAAGSKAAVLAHKDGGKLDLWQPSPTSVGNSAATLAMKNKGLSPNIDRGYTDVGKNNSLRAATMSHNQGRQRAGSMPTARPAAYPDSHNSGKNALNAATVSHRASNRGTSDGWGSEANQAARVKNIHMEKEMFGDHPPVEPELAEQKHQAALRASAVSMAKSMMEYHNRQPAPTDSDTSSLRMGSAGAGAEYAHRRNQSSMSQTDIKEEAIKYIHLQDAAHKLAQERLAKVEKDMEHEKYREHYGYGSQQGRRSRFSVRGRGRKRASSEGADFSDSDDEEQARRIRTQMTQLSSAQSTVDDKQRQEDRARLLAAAEKRVHARMHDMDEKVFLETGKPSQAMMDEWENKARERAEKDRAERAQHPGKTHIGGGKYMDQSEIEAIAAARLKPTLDELNDTAEKKRARDEEIRAQRDREETARMEEKMKDREVKAEFKRIKEQDKAAAKREKEERKAAQRAEKEAEKRRKSEEKRKSREQKRDEVAAVAGGAALAEVVSNQKEEEEEQKKDQEKAGEVLADALDKSKEEEEKEKLDKVATGATLAEVAERVKTNESEQSHEPARDVSGEATRDFAVAAPVAAAATAATVAAEEPESREQSKEEPREMTRESPKEKPQRRSMFGSISDRFKRKNKDEKAVSEPKQSIEEEEKHDDGAAAPVIGAQAAGLAAAAGVEEEHSPDEEKREVDESEKHDDGAAAPVVGLQGAGLAAATGPEEEHPTPAEEEKKLEKEDDKDIDKVQMASAIAGTAALGAVVAAGSVAAEQRRKSSDYGETVERQDHLADVSSLSTSDDELSDSDRELEGVVTAGEHTGDYNFAAPSPAVERKPDLERHISMIQDSSGSEPESDLDPTDEDEAPRGRLEPHPTVVGDFQDHPSPLAENTPLVISETAPSRFAQEPESPVSPLHPDAEDPVEDGKIVIVNAGASQDAPHVEVTHPEPERDDVSVAESGAPAPVVKSGPSEDEKLRKLEKKDDDKDKDKKEGGGVRGFFRKLKNKGKADHKLQKRHQPGATTSESSLSARAASKERKSESIKAPEPAPVEETKDENFITPVTTTSAAKDQEQHVGTDGPIGDPKHVSGLGGQPRPVSPSSFERYKAEPRHLDEVSSSGAEEEDYSRGRTGRLAQKLGLRQDKGKGKATDNGTSQSATSNGDEDQFEEARDQFDESLAPPPAFGGQMKSESPVRETRFQEQL